VNPEKIIICFFGQFEASYDLETVIETARWLEQTGDDKVQFVLCGNGTKFPSLRKQASGLSNVIFPGWVSASAIQALMQMSKIGLATYATNALQSLPNKPIEYFAGGLPILSSLRGELEIILTGHKCGLTYQAGNVDSFLSSLRQLRDNPDLLALMGRNARQLYEMSFSANRVYSSMIDHLEHIANNYSLGGKS